MPGFELFGDEERKQVNRVLDTGILARYGFEDLRSSVAAGLEQQLAESVGSSYAHLVSSGSTALVTMLATAGIGAGHEVILPVFGDVACFEAIVAVGAIPVPVDVNEDLECDMTAAEAAITSKTRAVLLVHVLGKAADAGAWQALCSRHGILLLEDASQAIGTVCNGKTAGTVGQAGVYSLDFHNTITCGEGGAIVTNHPAIYRLCTQYSDHGHDHLESQRRRDDHRYMGAGFRISELHAAVGLAQLKKLSAIVDRQRKLNRALCRSLEKVKGMRLRQATEGADNGSHVTFFLADEQAARAACAALEQQELLHSYWYDSKWHYIRKWEHFKNGSWMNRLYNDQKMNILHYSNQAFPLSDSIMSRCISVHISLRWTEADAAARGEAMAEAINKAVN